MPRVYDVLYTREQDNPNNRGKKMKYTIEFTELIDYLSQDIEADSEQEAIEKAFELMQNGMIPIANSNMDYCVSTERKEEPEPVTIIEPSLEAYIEGVARQFMNHDFHKTTNGAWCRAEVLDKGAFIDADGIEEDYYEVGVEWGCQDDTRNSKYGDTVYVHFDKAVDYWSFSLINPENLEEDPADRDDRLYHEEQDHIAMEKAKEKNK